MVCSAQVLWWGVRVHQTAPQGCKNHSTISRSGSAGSNFSSRPHFFWPPRLIITLRPFYPFYPVSIQVFAKLSHGSYGLLLGIFTLFCWLPKSFIFSVWIFLDIIGYFPQYQFSMELLMWPILAWVYICPFRMLAIRQTHVKEDTTSHPVSMRRP